MFLNLLHSRNPELIDYACHLLERGIIEPDSYVLDLDRIEANAAKLGETALSCGLGLYFMAKQLGHNPLVSRRVLGAPGFRGMVAVDFREALFLHEAGLPVRHLGHLVQVPRRAWDKALDMKPEVITLYSLEKAEELSTRALERGMVQDVLLRVLGGGDISYPGQEGGFDLDELPRITEAISALKGVRLAGLTSFPCFLFDEKAQKALATSNARSVQKGAALLGKLGLSCPHINMPSCNTLATLPLAAGLGATHAEPGHSLTGTSPDNIESPLAMPALCYVTEVSHSSGGYASCFGGGYYRRGNLRSALVKTSGGFEKTQVLNPDPETIDYHLRLKGKFPSGAPVCMAFRTQIFVTRSRVALIEGLSVSRPFLHSIWDSQGQRLPGGET
ncbi:MAG: alanine racemase [Treponema sp.]|nr:alanine racemase [Treponema sp.]